jgi:hypothetical protein
MPPWLAMVTFYLRDDAEYDDSPRNKNYLSKLLLIFDVCITQLCHMSYWKERHSKDMYKTQHQSSDRNRSQNRKCFDVRF